VGYLSQMNRVWFILPSSQSRTKEVRFFDALNGDQAFASVSELDSAVLD
jgi:hypothetical protein